MAKPNKAQRQLDRAAANLQSGLWAVYAHPIFGPLMHHVRINQQIGNRCPERGWAAITAGGVIHVQPLRVATPEEWGYLLAHCLLHLGFGHFQPHQHRLEWNAACDVFAADFLRRCGLGTPPAAMVGLLVLPARTEERIYERFIDSGIPPELQGYGTGGSGACDMLLEGGQIAQPPAASGRWRELFGNGLGEAVRTTIATASGVDSTDPDCRDQDAPTRARRWFVEHYPLLGALATSFTILQDAALCARMGIAVAAVDMRSREIYINPGAGLSELECRFVIAHELLHVGLRHDLRRRGRDHFLWNVACDYVINHWLVEMGVGELPRLGVLYDRTLAGESAESIYARIAADLRRARKLATLHGRGVGDMIERAGAGWWQGEEGAGLDEFYRRALAQGLEYHQAGGRGYLPAGLVEEIGALAQPAIGWDVALARWFDRHFAPKEPLRTYARASRRQGSTPDIPRPGYAQHPRDKDARTFGVVLDTSGSMDRGLLAKALGAIASYSLAHDVPAARVVFCDAEAYDQGYLAPEAIAGRVEVRGRGGTVLQPGIDLLESVTDFPSDGPLLIITDTFCDHVRVRRGHAFLIPQGRRLPFVPKGDVFTIA